MRKFYRNLLLGAICLLPLGLQAQSITNYAFSTATGTYTPITTTALTLSGGSADEGYYNNIPIGFSFCYMGQTYTTVCASTNGWASLAGTTATASITNDLPTGTAPRPVLAPLWDDSEVDATGSVRYETTGSVGNRIFTLQWDKIQWNYLAAGPVISFQMKLYEATGVIEFIYNQEAGAVNSGSASIGITAVGTGAGNYLSLSDASGAPTASSVVSTTTIATKPATGQIYRFSPPAAPPATPITMTFTGVTATGMTVNWVDNSTNESSFIVYRSTDNVIFTQVAVVPSASVGTTGTGYNYVASNLLGGTTYYWRVESRNELCNANAPLSGSQATNPPTMCGTYTVGPTGAYTSITAALTAIRTNGLLCPVVFDLQAAYVSTVETFPLDFSNLGTTATLGITIRPELGATNLSVTSTAAQTVNMNGGDYITFDGRPGSIGTNRELTIENTSVTGVAVQLSNDAQNNTFNYMKLRGQNNTTTSGVVVFGIGATTAGNVNNTISNSEIYRTAGGQPANLVFSNNTLASSFNTNTITNSLLYDNFQAGLTCIGILLTGGNTGWTITNNSFYQTTTQTFTTANTHRAIQVNNSAGNNFTISGNFIGGTAANCGGTAWTIAGALASRFIAIDLSVGTTVASNVHNNTIRNFNLTTTSGATTSNGIWCGINTTGGNVNIGTVLTPNTIGSTTVTGAIVTSCSTSGGITVGINNSSAGTLNIIGNQIGGITANSSAITISSSVVGIQSTGGTATISNNLVGSTTLLSSSIINAASTSATAGIVTGIFSSSGLTTVISNNTVAALSSQYAGTSTSGQTRGIVTTGGTNTISGNTIAGIGGVQTHTGSGTTASVLGISQQSTLAGQTVTQNIIQGIGNVGTTGNVMVTGIQYTAATTGTNVVSRNTIIGLGAPNNTGAPIINGIRVDGGVSTFSNNMIVLGVDPAGTSYTRSQEYNGIFKNTTANNNFYFNSVSIDGAGVGAGAANTYAFRRASTGTDIVMNNIFSNNRSNGASTGIHYSIFLNNNTTITLNNNDYYGAGTGYTLGNANATNYATFALWQAAVTPQDNLSFNVNPNFQAVTNLHINNAAPSVLESGGVDIAGITVDIDGQNRPGPTGSVNGGAVNSDIGADEFDGLIVANSNLNLATVLLVSPNTGCGTNPATVTFRIRNNGLTTIDFSVNNATFTSGVTGTNAIVFPPVALNTGTLAPGATQDIVVSTTYNYATVGGYNFTGTITVAGDVVTSNNTLSTVLANNTMPAPVANTSASPICLGQSVDLSTTSNYVAPPATILSQNFESGLGSWTTVNNSTGGTNPAGTAWAIQTQGYVYNLETFNSGGGTSFIMTNSDIAGSGVNCNTFLISPTFNTVGYGTVSLSLRHYYNTGTTNEANVEVSTNGGASWVTVRTYPNTDQGTSSNFATDVINLNAFANQSQVQVRLRYTTTWWWYWAVDDITITGTGLTPTYSWTSTPSGFTSTQQNPTGVAPTATTLYTVATTNGFCSATSSVNVTVNPVPSLSTSVTNVTCGSNNGAVDLTVTGGTPGYTYLWSNSATTQDISGLASGLYSVTVTDANNCTATTSAAVIQPSAPVLSVNTITDVSCPGGNNGAIDINITGGNPGYTYLWSNSSTSQDISGLTAGSYSVVVTDQSLCTTSDTIVVNQPNAFVLNTTVTNVSCNAGNNGAVDLTPSGGTGAYTYNWLPGGASTQDISGLTIGSYTVTLTDANNCTATTSATVTEPLALGTNATVTNISCNGLSDGSVDLTVTGGITAYTYNWTPGGYTVEDPSNLALGTYTVVVTDANSCTITTTIAITQPTVLTSTASGTDISCFQGNDGTGTVSASGGTTAYTYSWSSGGTNANETGLIAGSYTVTVTDANGCTSSNTITLTEPLLLTAVITSSADVNCPGGADGSATVQAGFGTPGYTYSWAPSGGSGATASNLGSGTYTATVTDANGCTATSTTTINVPAPIVITPTTTDEINGNDGSASIAVSGGTAPYTYSWSNGGNTQNIFALPGGTYTVTVTDANGCTQTATVVVNSQLGINVNEVNGTIGIYPNPNNGIFNISVAGFNGGDLRIETMDVSGKMLDQQLMQNAPSDFVRPMDLRNLPVGTYFIRLISDKGTSTHRVVIAID